MSGKRPPSSDGSSKGRTIEQLKKELAARQQRLGSLSGSGQARPNFCRVCHLSRAKPSRDSPPHFSTCKGNCPGFEKCRAPAPERLRLHPEHKKKLIRQKLELEMEELKKELQLKVTRLPVAYGVIASPYARVLCCCHRRTRRPNSSLALATNSPVRWKPSWTTSRSTTCAQSR